MVPPWPLSYRNWISFAGSGHWESWSNEKREGEKVSWKMTDGHYGFCDAKTGESGSFSAFAQRVGYANIFRLCDDMIDGESVRVYESSVAPKVQLVARETEAISTDSLGQTKRNLANYRREKVTDFLTMRGGILESKIKYHSGDIIYSDLDTVNGEEIAWAPEWKRKLYGLHVNHGGSIMFPIYDCAGDVRSYQMKFDAPTGDFANRKYSLLPGTRKSWNGKEYHFGCPKIDLSANTIVIVEGAMDTWVVRTMMASSSELDPAEGTIVIGAIDAGGFTKLGHNITGFKGRVIILNDNDQAGMDAGDKLEKSLKDQDIKYTRIDWKRLTNKIGAPNDTKDIGDLIKITHWNDVRAALRMMIYGDAKQYTVDDSAVDWDAIWAVRDANNQYNEDDTQLAA